jgi:glycosyltransferase involved in cell wall biosynthesis
MKKILVVSEKYAPQGSGAELATHLLLNLLKTNFDITVLTGTKEPLRSDGVRFIYSDLLNVSNKLLLWRNLLILRRSHWFFELVKGTDVVYVPRISYTVIPLAKRLGKRVVVHLHDYQPLSYNSVLFRYVDRSSLSASAEVKNLVTVELADHRSRSRVLASSVALPANDLAATSLRDADAIICVSRRQAEIMASGMPELASKIRVIYNPPPKVAFRSRKSWDPALSYVGGSSYIKGLRVLLKASFTLSRNTSAKLMLIGIKEPERSKFELLSKNSSLYMPAGRVSDDEITRIREASSALVVPSIWEEPAPYSVVESMLAGTLPLASRIGGIPELVSGTFAEQLQFTSGDVNELVQRMVLVLSLSNEQLLDIGLGLREQIKKKFDLEKSMPEYLRAFDSA